MLLRIHIALPTAVLHLADYISACYRHLNFNRFLALPIDTPEPKLSPLVQAGTIIIFYIRWVVSDSMAWVEMVHSESGSYITVDVNVLKQGNSLGIHFKEEFVADKYQVSTIFFFLSCHQINIRNFIFDSAGLLPKRH